MTKAEIVKQVAAATCIESMAVSVVVECFMEQVRSLLATGENVYLHGFGTFLLKHRAEKKARNISKNKTLVVPAHDIPAFIRPSPEFSRKVR